MAVKMGSYTRTAACEISHDSRRSQKRVRRIKQRHVRMQREKMRSYARTTAWGTAAGVKKPGKHDRM